MIIDWSIKTIKEEIIEEKEVLGEIKEYKEDLNEEKEETIKKDERMIDEEISRIVRNAQRCAEEILKKEMKLLQRLAQELLKYETLNAKDLEKILEGKKLTRRMNGRSNNEKRPASRQRVTKTRRKPKIITSNAPKKQPQKQRTKE